MRRRGGGRRRREEGGGGACNVTRFDGLVGGRAGGYSRERHGFTLRAGD